MPPKVLIVEDDIFIAMSLEELVFETLTAIPMTAQSIAEASRALSANFDFALSYVH